MDVIIICHTEFGIVLNKQIIFQKDGIEGVTLAVENLINVVDKYKAKVTFAVCPEVTEYFPLKIKHEIGLHIHPGWQESKSQGIKYMVGDAYLREHCRQSVNSTALRDYTYVEQLDMIKCGKMHLIKVFGIEPKTFVSGRWSVNNDTIKALIEAGITHDFSAPAHARAVRYDWSKLPRICMPYHPSEDDYQEKGTLPLLLVPVSRFFPRGNVNPEITPLVGLNWLKSCFQEYHYRKQPLFHICLHSPCMIDAYFISVMDDFLNFISSHNDINFIFGSEVQAYSKLTKNMNLLPYVSGINRNIINTILRQIAIR
jgi:hypothetical protein